MYDKARPRLHEMNETAIPVQEISTRPIEFQANLAEFPTVREEETTAAYAIWVVVLLVISYTFSFADRQILSLLVGPIKRDLALSDTKIGLLQGLAFAVFYAALGIPLGRLADKGSRRNMISIGVFFWSLMTSVCSLARSFGSLFAARVGVGVGEATLSPAAVPLLSDYFSDARLGTALSIYTMGAAIGSGLALVLGGVVVDMVTRWHTVYVPVIGAVAPWRLTFVVVGLPGILFALLIRTVKEPARRNLLRTHDGQLVDPTFREVLVHLRHRWQSMVGMSTGMVFQAICGIAFFAWAPAFFQRVHGWTAGQAGKAIGLSTLVFCTAGMYLGGVLSDYWQRRGVWEGPLRVALISAIGIGTSLTAAVIVTNNGFALILMAASLFFIGLPTGSVYAAIQKIFPNQIRGQVSAVFFMALNLGGTVLGAFLPGFFDDHLFRSDRMIGFSIALTVGMSSLAMLFIFPATFRSYRRDYVVSNPGATGLISK